jgi:hypothetical protein
VDYLALFVSLPTRASSGRMRVWRALKALGCATLRDGVYLLPDTPDHDAALGGVADDALKADGSAEIYRLTARDAAQAAALQALFDRGEDYAEVVAEVRGLRETLAQLDVAAAQRREQALRRRFEQVLRADFFPGEAQRQALAELGALHTAVARLLSPDEPTPAQADVPRRDPADYRGRTWATRARPWVDRMASAWLIRRFIDPEARFAWLTSPADCRADWLGFDFDGATFTHVGGRVTFETLLASFGLDDDPALRRVANLVHTLDIGGLPVAEAPGVETLLAGVRAAEPDDDVLIERASSIFDWLLQSYKDHTE